MTALWLLMFTVHFTDIITTMNVNALKILYVSNGVFVFAGAMLVPLYALFAESVGADMLTISVLAATMLISKVLATISIRWLGDSVAETEYLLILGFLLRALGWLVLLFFPIVFGLFVAQIIIGFGDGVGSPTFRAIFATHLDSGTEVRRYSEWELILATAGAVGAIVGGYIVTMFGFSTLLVFMSALALVSIVTVLLQSRTLL